MAKVISQLPSGGSVPKHNNLLGLNEGDYLHLTQFEKAKLDGIQSGAEVNVNADWNAISGDAQILNKPASFPPSTHTHTISEITDFPTIQTIDNIPTDGSNNAVSSNGVFDALATKAPLASPSLTGTPTSPTATAGTNTTQVATTAFVTNGIATADSQNVKLTGNQTISGQKSFSLTGKIDMQTNNAFPAISVTSLGSNGQSAAEFINNSSSPYSTALRLRTSLSGGVGNMALNVSNQSSIGTGIVSNASNGGVSISSESGNGDSYVSNITLGGTGRNYVGRNDGTETYSVDKIGNVIGSSYIKRSAPTTNLLLAGGGDIEQGTFALASSVHNPVTLGTANGLSLSTQQLSLGLASSGVTGALSGTDWNTFNNKQDAFGYTPENVANKQNSLAVDGTGAKYPTVDAISEGVNYKRTISQIRALTGTLPNTNFYTTDLGQEGNWYYDSTDTTSADNTGTVLVTADGKRIKRVVSGYVNVKWFGAKGNNINDDTSSINTAIQYIENKFGGTLFFPSGVYSVSSRIIGRRSVVLKGEGGFDYSGMPTQYGTTIKPTSGFSSPEVILFDSNTDSTALFSGSGIQDFAIDMDNISASGRSGIVIKSGSNLCFMKNIVVNKLDHGSELVLDGSSFSGALATDGIEISSFFTYGKTSGYASNIPKLIIKGNVNEVSFRGCKFQSKSNAVSGTISAYVGTGARGITFDSCAFAGNETGLKIESTEEISSPPEWIRVINSTFETYRYGVYVDATGSDVSFYPKFISVESGNRFIAPTGANVRNVYLGKSTGASIILDEFVQAGTSGTSLLCEVTSNAVGAVVNAQPTQVVNSSTSTSVNGRINNYQSFNKIQISGANGANDLILKNSLGTTGNGVIRWTGTSNTDQAAVASNYTISDVGGLEFLNGGVLGAYLSSSGVFRLPNLSGTGSRLVLSDASGNLSAPAIPTAPTAPAGTNTTQIATTAFVSAVARPYKVYVALLSQSGTGIPTAIVLENTTGETPMLSRVGIGTYQISLTVPQTKTFVTSTAANNNYINAIGVNGLGTAVNIYTSFPANGGGSSPQDSLLNKTPIEIRIYP